MNRTAWGLRIRKLPDRCVPAKAWGGSRGSIVPLPNAHFNRPWLSRVVEVIYRYRPDPVYFDTKLNNLDPTYRLAMSSHYYNKAEEWDREAGVNRIFSGPEKNAKKL